MMMRLKGDAPIHSEVITHRDDIRQGVGDLVMRLDETQYQCKRDKLEHSTRRTNDSIKYK